MRVGSGVKCFEHNRPRLVSRDKKTPRLLRHGHVPGRAWRVATGERNRGDARGICEYVLARAGIGSCSDADANWHICICIGALEIKL